MYLEHTAANAKWNWILFADIGNREQKFKSIRKKRWRRKINGHQPTTILQLLHFFICKIIIFTTLHWSSLMFAVLSSLFLKLHWLSVFPCNKTEISAVQKKQYSQTLKETNCQRKIQQNSFNCLEIISNSFILHFKNSLFI